MIRDAKKARHLIQFSLVYREFITLIVRDDKHQIDSMRSRGVEPLYPRITLKNRKLLLLPPFQQEQEKKEHSKPSYSKDDKSTRLGLGIDLGLKHLVTISIWDEENKKEVAWYFLNPRQFFDIVFDENIGKFRYQANFKVNEKIRYRSNIKSTLIRLRQQITGLQRKKNEYKQCCRERNIRNYKDRLKWNTTCKELSQC